MTSETNLLTNPIPNPLPSLDEIDPAASSILQARRFAPRAVVPICISASADTSNLHGCVCGSDTFAATICTRSQIASSLRERSEAMALHTFSLMCAEAVLESAKTRHKVVFGVMCDREIVRLHVDWVDPWVSWHLLLYLTSILKVQCRIQFISVHP